MSNKIAMYSDNGTEVWVLPDSVERMEQIGWSKDKPKAKKSNPVKKDQEEKENSEQI